MLFNEIYSVYYRAVARLINAANTDILTEDKIKEIVKRTAFSESALTVLLAIREENWKIIRKDLTTPIKNTPSTPLTTLEKQWLKALLLDPRVKLFDIPKELTSALDDVEPLFTPENYRVFDKYGDGDPYSDEGYIKRFKTVLYALKTGTPLQIESLDKNSVKRRAIMFPEKLEYSEKDDKFRLIGRGYKYSKTVNLAKMISCRPYDNFLFPAESADFVSELSSNSDKTLVLKIINERNALERVMLHFAHFEKQAERIDENAYRLTLKYSSSDETELVIRILSFGPLVEVEAPDAFRQEIISRLLKQKRYIRA